MTYMTEERAQWLVDHDVLVCTSLDGPEDLHNFIQHLGLERPHLAGTAAGARPALEYVLAHPEAIGSVVLADCGAGASSEPEYLEMRRNYLPPEVDALPVEVRELSAGYRGANPEGTARWLEIEHANQERAGTGALRAQNPVTFAMLETMKVPTLMLCGGADLVMPPALMRLSAAHIPNCRFETVPEAGHAAFWEQPETWNRIVLEFIGQNARSS
jgi:pimeloyl-ACP methyl ester carboxylesterase